MDETSMSQSEWQDAVLTNERRQTEALESIRGILLFFVAVAIVAALVAVAMITSG